MKESKIKEFTNYHKEQVLENLSDEVAPEMAEELSYIMDNEKNPEVFISKKIQELNQKTEGDQEEVKFYEEALKIMNMFTGNSTEDLSNAEGDEYAFVKLNEFPNNDIAPQRVIGAYVDKYLEDIEEFNEKPTFEQDDSINYEEILEFAKDAMGSSENPDVEMMKRKMVLLMEQDLDKEDMKVQEDARDKAQNTLSNLDPSDPSDRDFVCASTISTIITTTNDEIKSYKKEINKRSLEITATDMLLELIKSQTYNLDATIQRAILEEKIYAFYEVGRGMSDGEIDRYVGSAIPYIADKMIIESGVYSDLVNPYEKNGGVFYSGFRAYDRNIGSELSSNKYDEIIITELRKQEDEVLSKLRDVKEEKDPKALKSKLMKM